MEGVHYTGYEATQMQRKLETAIRIQKYRIMADKATGDQKKLSQDKTKLTILRQRYREFSKAAGLRTQEERTEVAGFGEKRGGSQSTGGESTRPGTPVQVGTVDFSDKQAVLARLDAAQRETVGLDYEVNHTVTTDGKVWRVDGEAGTVNPSAIPSSLTGSYSYHNHPAEKTWFSFSADDVRFFFQSGAAYAKASDSLYEYIMQRTPETLAVDPDVVYHRFKEIFDLEVMKLSFDEEINIDMDGFHEAMRRISMEYGFFYERMKFDAGQ